MILFISPAKTFRKNDISYQQAPFFLKEATYINKQLKALPIETLKKKMKLSDKLATQVYTDYQNFNKHHQAAIHSYYGHQYKHIDIDSLEQHYHDQIKQHVFILSGLYGILNAYDDISFYRLEMQDKTLFNLYQYWKPKIKAYIDTHYKHEVIYNLCSNEYGQLIDYLDQCITIDIYQLKNDKLKIHSMEAKRMRGLFVHHLIQNPNIDIKQLIIDGYHYSKNHSTDKHYVFIKEIAL